jgi:hypothetical protein
MVAMQKVESSSLFSRFGESPAFVAGLSSFGGVACRVYVPESCPPHAGGIASIRFAERFVEGRRRPTRGEVVPLIEVGLVPLRAA